MSIYPPDINISKVIRDGLAELIESDATLAANFTQNGSFKAYETSFLDEFITNSPALAVFDMTDIEYSRMSPMIEEAKEKFFIQVAYESADWWDAKNTVSNLALGVRNAIRNYRNTISNLTDVAKFIEIKSVKAVEAKNDRMWLYIANIEVIVTYEEGSFLQ